MPTDKQIEEAVAKWEESTELHNVTWVHKLGEFAQSYLAFSKQDGVPGEKEKIEGEYSCNRCATEGSNQTRQEMLLWIMGRAVVERLKDIIYKKYPLYKNLISPEVDKIIQTISQEILGGKE